MSDDSATRAPAPTVSVLVMTYNHERFIAQALDSVLMQQGDVHYEIVVSEDLSTDRTREIVVDYQRRYPDRIRLLLSTQNLHSNAVVTRGFEAARGKYIALLDGDDYWTGWHKLRKQVDFLDGHPECSMCFHNVVVLDDTGERPPRLWTPANQKETSGLADIWRGNFIATCSAMYRAGLVDPLPEWYVPMFPITDWPLHILHAEHGAIGYIDEVMGVYRHHAGGLYSPLEQEQKLEATAGFYAVMNRNFDGRYQRVIRSAAFRYFHEWAQEYERLGEVARARACLRRSVQGWPLGTLVHLREVGALWLRLLRRGMGAGGEGR